MKIKDTSTPVVVVNCKIGALAIMRSLGSQGIPIYGVDGDPGAPALLSKYCREKFSMSLREDNSDAFLEYLLKIGEKIGRRSVLIPTSDETAVFVTERSEELKERFIFANNDPALMKGLISKREMHDIALRSNVPTAHTEFPATVEDARAYARSARFPVMIKGIFGNRLAERTGKKMVLARSAEELMDYYRLLEDPERPNLMFQEYIPGEDDQIYIFNGYFNGNSDCLAAFTGHKIRQFPVHVGCASLGICKWNADVARITAQFMKDIGYRGILDIGYRYDARDGRYKVLDINPRIGQAFRLFLARNGMDVARALYMDLTGQELFEVVPREGRKWLIENFDVISSYHYHKEGSLGFFKWIGSFKGVEEGAWFSWKDPVPFIHMSSELLKKTIHWTGKRLTRGGRKKKQGEAAEGALAH